MKKIIALALCLVMVLGLLAGCGEKPMDVKTLTQKMDEAAKNQTSAAYKMALELEMTMGMEGMTLTMGADANLDMKADLAKNALWVDVDAALDVLGETQEIGMEIYTGTAEDGTATMYIYEDSTGTWMKAAMEDFAGQISQMQGSTIKMSDIPQEKMTLAEEKQTVGTSECFVLTMDADGSFFSEQMNSMMGAAAETMDEETAAMLENLDWSKLNVKAVYFVDAKTFQTVQMDMDVQGFGEMMDEVLGAAVAELMALMGGEDMEITIEVPVFKASLTEMTYTGIEVPAVPQEAIDNAVDALVEEEDPSVGVLDEEQWQNSEPQADGSYLLTDGTDSVSVFPPEGYEIYMADQEIVMALTADMMGSVTFMLAPGYTAADMEAEYLATIEETKEAGYYLSHSELESINGFYQMSLTYNDGSAEICAWRELTNGVLLVSAAAYGEVAPLDDVLNAIVLGE